MDLGAVEAAGEVRISRIPVMAVAYEQRVEALRGAVLKRYPPPATGPPLGVLHARVEADRLAQVERVGVVAEPLEDMRVVWIVRVAVRHREVAEGDRRLGYVDVQRAVCRGDAVGVAEVPVAADLVGRLEALVRHAEVRQRLAGGQATHAGADHTDCGELTHCRDPSGRWTATRMQPNAGRRPLVNRPAATGRSTTGRR